MAFSLLLLLFFFALFHKKGKKHKKLKKKPHRSPHYPISERNLFLLFFPHFWVFFFALLLLGKAPTARQWTVLMFSDVVECAAPCRGSTSSLSLSLSFFLSFFLPIPNWCGRSRWPLCLDTALVSCHLRSLTLALPTSSTSTGNPMNLKTKKKQTK